MIAPQIAALYVTDQVSADVRADPSAWMLARGLLLQAGYAAVTQRISAVRASLSGAQDDRGVVVNNADNIVPVDGNSVAFSRTTRQVLSILYGSQNASSGLFFPNGLNGAIRWPGRRSGHSPRPALRHSALPPRFRRGLSWSAPRRTRRLPPPRPPCS